MARLYELEIGKELFEITYFPGTIEISVHCQPKGKPWQSYEMLRTSKYGENEELGSRGEAKRIRAALPEMQHSDLPSDVKKALQGIQL